MAPRQSAVLFCVLCVIASSCVKGDESACDAGCRAKCDVKKAARCKLFSTGTTLSAEMTKILEEEIKDAAKMKAMLRILLTIDGFTITNDVVSCLQLKYILKHFVRKDADQRALKDITSAAKSRDLVSITPYIRILKMKTLNKMVTALSKEHKKGICRAVFGEQRLPCPLVYIVENKLNCKTALDSDKDVSDEVKDKMKEKEFEQTLESKDPENWTTADCTKNIQDFPGQLKPRHIKKCSAQSVLDARDALTQDCHRIENATKKMLVDKVSPLTKADKSDKNTKLMLACEARIDKLVANGFKVEDLLGIITKEDIMAMSAKELLRLQIQLKKEVKRDFAAEPDTEKLEKLIFILCKTRNIHELKKIPKDKLKNVLSLVKEKSCPGLTKILNPRAEDIDTKEKIMTFGCLLMEMSETQMKRIPRNKLVEAIQDSLLTDCTDFDKNYCKSWKIIMKHLKAEKVIITATIMEKLGPLKKCFTYSDLLELDAETLCDPKVKKIIKTRTVDERKPSGKECRRIKKKLTFDCMKDLKICLDLVDADTIADGITTTKFDVVIKSPRKVLKKLLEKHGDDFCDWDLGILNNLKDSNVLGYIPCRQIKACSNDDAQDRIEIILESKGLPSDKMNCLTEKYFDLTKNKNNVNVQSIPKRALIRLSTKDKNKLLGRDDNDCITGDECSALGEDATMMEMTIKQVRSKALECLKCVQKSGSLTAETLQEMGKLTCNWFRDELARIAAPDLLDIDFDQCPASVTKNRLEQLVAIFKALGKQNLDELDASDAVRIGALMIYPPGKPKTDVFCQTIVEVVRKVKNMVDKAKERDKAMPQEGSSKSLKEPKNEFIKKSMQRYISECQSPQTKRRKRSTPSIDCDTITLFGSDGVESLTTDHYTSLGAQDFKDCLTTFCTAESISDTQAAAFVTRAKQEDVWGAARNWTDDNVESACGYAKGLGSSDITDLTFSDTIATLLGKVSPWSQSQLTALYQQYMTEVHTSQDSSTLESLHLLTLGHGVCGASINDIQNMNSSHIDAALPSFAGEDCCLADCSNEKLSEFHKKIQDIIGTNIAAYTPETIEKIGTIISGISLDDFKTLTTEQIPVIAKQAFAKLPDNFIKEMSNVQLGSMIKAQVNALTDAQKSGLSDEQFNILAAIADHDLKTPSSGMTIVGSVTLTLVSSVCVLFVIY